MRHHARQPVRFGDYNVEEGKRTVTFHIVSSTFPTWAGEKQTRRIDTLTADAFVNTNPHVAGGRSSARNIYRRSR